MKALEPFKVRKGRAYEALEAAIRSFGQPSEITRWASKSVARWHFYDSSLFRYGLEIVFDDLSDTLSMQMEIANTKPDETICGQVLAGETSQKVLDFVEEVRKPWGEWSEEEIMESPMWVCMYRRDGNPPTRAMDNMMHMFSFKDPGNLWVKMYFQPGVPRVA